MSVIDWKIPPSTLRLLAEAPAHRPVAVLIRHSVRPSPLPPGSAGNLVNLTEDGVRLAHELGRLLGPRLRSLHTSPVIRCVQTAEALRAGAGIDLPAIHDRLLGDPGVFVHDGRAAAATWRDLGHEGTMAKLVTSDDPLPAMARPEPAARFLVHRMLSGSSEPGLHVFVTHDSLVTTTAARLLQAPFGRDDWPQYLEAAFFWIDADGEVVCAYRDSRRACGLHPVCGLNETDIIEFARREVGNVLGFDCAARFFLAGGAFKSLLTGRPPRDLDLWAASDRDRVRLVDRLLSRGARVTTLTEYSHVLELQGRRIDVPMKTELPTLEERLDRFDIGLSAVGVEHLGGDRWRAAIHPLALQSVRARQVLLVKPLRNWKYALVTRERLKRYAAELNYAVPQSELDEIARVYEDQPADMRVGMIQRFERVMRSGD